MSCSDCGRPEDDGAALCAPCWDRRVDKGLRLDKAMRVLSSNAGEVEERAAARHRQTSRESWRKKHGTSRLPRGLNRLVVARRVFGRREARQLGSPELAKQALLTLECGHHVLRARGRVGAQARCGHCEILEREAAAASAW